MDHVLLLIQKIKWDCSRMLMSLRDPINLKKHVTISIIFPDKKTHVIYICNNFNL